MDWNGERQRGVTLDEIEPKHIERYRWAAKYAKGRVLDAACGCGYGSYILKTEGQVNSVLGLDYSKEAINYAKCHWIHTGVQFIQYDLLDDMTLFSNFDTIVSFETIEHLNQPLQDTLIKFISVLNPYGALFMSHPLNETTHSKFHKHICIGINTIPDLLRQYGMKVVVSSTQPGRGSFDYHVIMAVRK